MTNVYINQIATAVPKFDVHQKFIDCITAQLKDETTRKLFTRMTKRAHVEHRYSFIQPSMSDESWDESHFYRAGAFPDTTRRMQQYQDSAVHLAQSACDQLPREELEKVTHLIVTSCTGFYAPGLDFDIARHYGMTGSVERTMIGFMGCSAAMNGLKMARHIVRSEPEARVLMVNTELCTLHLQDSEKMEELLAFLIFADGCAATLISARPGPIQVDGFYSAALPASEEQLTWQIGQMGFDMVLSGLVPNSVAQHLPQIIPVALSDSNVAEIDHWAVHPGGNSILDAVTKSLSLPADALDASRRVLRDYGNMSSATVMFVLQELLSSKPMAGDGCALAFGPGITAEAMRFKVV